MGKIRVPHEIFQKLHFIEPDKVSGFTKEFPQIVFRNNEYYFRKAIMAQTLDFFVRRYWFHKIEPTSFCVLFCSGKRVIFNIKNIAAKKHTDYPELKLPLLEKCPIIIMI